jgi:hypothetical protein
MPLSLRFQSAFRGGPLKFVILDAIVLLSVFGIVYSISQTEIGGVDSGAPELQQRDSQIYFGLGFWLLLITFGSRVLYIVVALIYTRQPPKEYEEAWVRKEDSHGSFTVRRMVSVHKDAQGNVL